MMNNGIKALPCRFLPIVARILAIGSQFFRSDLEILDLTKRKVLQLNLSQNDEQWYKSAAVQISALFGICYHVDWQKAF